MQNGVIAAPTYDMGRTVVDRPLDESLTVVWQVPLAGSEPRDARIHTVSGEAVLTSAERGVVTLGADPPVLQPDADLWPVPVSVIGSGYPGQLMVIDEADTVYRLAPGVAPVPVWHCREDPNYTSVDGLPSGRLMVSSFDDAWSPTREIRTGTSLIEESTGEVLWHSPVMLSPVMPTGGQVIGGADRDDLVSLDFGTGGELWRRKRAMLSASDAIAVVDGVLWTADPINERLVGFAVDSGREAAAIAMPRPSRLTGLLDQAGTFHIGDEDGWLAVDLVHARVAADIRFEPSGMGGVYKSRTVRSADGRLVLADDRGQIFVVHPEDARKPRRVATCPPIQDIGIAAGRLLVLSHDGTLTALGRPS
ncbi:hypothetical protein [Actinomadura sp. 9N215]|uniref:hypothetical protein n=1 Tax=Actinomadura sp. 9N215 TaxID=3375150 RepID=UPI0037B42E38